MLRSRKIIVLVLIRKKKKNDECKLFFLNWKINILVHIRKKLKMMRVSENTISSEKCMYFTCFPRLSIGRGAWLFFVVVKIRWGSVWEPRLFCGLSLPWTSESLALEPARSLRRDFCILRLYNSWLPNILLPKLGDQLFHGCDICRPLHNYFGIIMIIMIIMIIVIMIIIIMIIIINITITIIIIITIIITTIINIPLYKICPIL